MQPRSLRARGAHGLELHLLEWSTEGTPLLLVHGFGNDAHVWDDFAPTVAPYYRTLALDLRGHGDSARDPERRYDVGTLVADVEAVCASLALDRLVLCAHSLGGRVATLFAGAHPERMAGLVIVDVGPELDARGVSRIRTEVGSQPRDQSFGSVAEYAALLARNYPAARPAAVERMARTGSRLREDGRFEPKLDPALRRLGSGESAEDAAAREERTRAALWDALRRIPCPVLVVRGAASDVLSPDTADRMTEALPKGCLAVVPRASHSVMLDNPQGFQEAVATFVLG